MCENRYNFPQPWNNSFFHHYLQQHAAMSYHFQKLHSNIHHYGDQYFGMYNPAVPCNYEDNRSYCSSSCSCSSCSGSSKTANEYEEEMDSEEGYDENEDYEEDESECEYEFNVDAILAMRAAKEELKKQEAAELKDDESSSAVSKEDSSSVSKEGESPGSKDEKESNSDSIVLVDSDKEDFEFINFSCADILTSNICQVIGEFNKSEEEENKRRLKKHLFGTENEKIDTLESNLSLSFAHEYDELLPSLWPVLPLRL